MLPENYKTVSPIVEADGVRITLILRQPVDS